MGKSITGGRVQSLLKEAALVTWLPWLLARVAVTLALIASKFEVTHFTPLNSKAVELSRNGLLGYDAGWYQSIAANGYGGSGYSSERFYPLFPLLIKSLHLLTPFGWSFITVVLANAIPPERTGVYMGIFNMMIVIPMLLLSVTLPFMYGPLLGGDPRNVLRMSGVLLGLAALSAVWVSRKESAA